jgi:hypothetical protein
VWHRGHDDGRKFGGVTGATWCEGRTILKDGLPQLNSHSSASEIEHYAKETFMDAKSLWQRIKNGRSFPRMLCGIVVEVNNKPWGVICIDSQFDTLVPREIIEAFYNKNAKVLGKLLAVL